MGRRNKLNYVVDGVIGLAFALAALTGLAFLLPDAFGAGGQVFLGLSRGTWRDLHRWIGLVLAAGVLVHLVLHWRWIVRMTVRRGTAAARLNYVLGLVIAIAGIAALLSGLVFLFGGQGGFQGGRNPAFRTEMLGLARQTWSDLHTWTSLVLIVGVAVHLVLHADWIVCITRQLWRGRRAALNRSGFHQPGDQVCENEA